MTVSWRVSVCPSGTGLGMYIYENIYLYWIYGANSLGSICQLNIYVGIGYIIPTVGGDECKLVSFSVPFGRMVGEYIYFKIYLCVGYMLQTILGVYLNIYVGVGYSSLGIIVVAVGGRVGK